MISPGSSPPYSPSIFNNIFSFGVTLIRFACVYNKFSSSKCVPRIPAVAIRKNSGKFVFFKINKSKYPSSIKASGANFSKPPTEFVLAIKNNIIRSEEHTSELQSRGHLVCRLLLEKKKNKKKLDKNKKYSHKK